MSPSAVSTSVCRLAAATSTMLLPCGVYIHTHIYIHIYIYIIYSFIFMFIVLYFQCWISESSNFQAPHSLENEIWQQLHGFKDDSKSAVRQLLHTFKPHAAQATSPECIFFNFSPCVHPVAAHINYTLNKGEITTSMATACGTRIS